MDVKIDDLELIKRVDDSDTHVVKEIRSVSSIEMDDKRAIVELRIPGAEGSILQDLGRLPVVVTFEGELQGEDAKTTLQNLRAKFKAGKPLSFSSDLTGVAEVTQVLIEDLHIDEGMGSSSTYEYTLTLREYIEPKEPEEEKPPSQDDDAKDAVDDETDDAVSTVNYITGKVVDHEGKPEVKVKVTITDGQGNEYDIETNDQGIYRKDDLEPGSYVVHVEAPGYEEVKEHVTIQGKSGEGGGEEAGGGEEGGGEEGGEESGGGEGSGEDEGESGGEEGGAEGSGGDEASGEGGSDNES
jgi:carboxypeptidase family protein